MDRSHLAPLTCVCPWLFPERETSPLTLFLSSRTFSLLVLHSTPPAPWFLFPPPRFLLMAQRGELWCQLACTSTGTAPVPLHLFQGWVTAEPGPFFQPRRRIPPHHCDLVRAQSWSDCQRDLPRMQHMLMLTHQHTNLQRTREIDAHWGEREGLRKRNKQSD